MAQAHYHTKIRPGFWAHGLNRRVEASEDEDRLPTEIRSWARRHVPEPEKGTRAAAATARAEDGRALDVPLLLPFPFQKTGGKKKKSK